MLSQEKKFPIYYRKLKTKKKGSFAKCGKE